jgi:hypothetical protein
MVVLARDYLKRIQDFSPNARLFLVAAALGGLSSGVSGVLLNLYVLALGYDREFLGRLLSFGPVGAVLGAVVAIPLVYAWSIKRAMLVGIAVAGSGAVTLLVSSAPNALSAGIALTTFGSIMFYTAVPPFLAKHSTPRERAHLFGVTVAAYVVSAATGGLLGGYLYRLVTVIWPEAAPADAYRLTLFAGALLTATGIPLIAMVREELPARTPSGNRRSVDRGSPGGPGLLHTIRAHVDSLRTDLLHRRTVILLGQFIVADLLIRFGGNLVLPFMNVHFVQELGASEEAFGTVRFLERAIVVAATLAAAPVALRFGPVATVAATQILSVPLLLGVGFAPTVALAGMAYLIRGPLMEMTVPTRDAFLMESMPERARTSANAAMQLAGYAVAWVALRLSGGLIEAWGFGLVCVLTGALYIASAILYWWFFRAMPQASPGRRVDLAMAVG